MCEEDTWDRQRGWLVRLPRSLVLPLGPEGPASLLIWDSRAIALKVHTSKYACLVLCSFLGLQFWFWTPGVRQPPMSEVPTELLRGATGAERVMHRSF